MASGSFVNPMPLLQLAPLLSSTAHVWYSFDQLQFLSIFTSAELRDRKETKTVLPIYWRKFFYPGAGFVILLHLITIVTGILNLRLGLGSKGADRWYGLGVAFSLGHFIYVPIVAPKIWAVMDEKKSEESTREMSGWLARHVARIFTVDLPGWICMVIGACKALEPAA